MHDPDAEALGESWRQRMDAAAGTAIAELGTKLASNSAIANPPSIRRMSHPDPVDINGFGV